MKREREEAMKREREKDVKGWREREGRFYDFRVWDLGEKGKMSVVLNLFAQVTKSYYCTSPISI